MSIVTTNIPITTDSCNAMIRQLQVKYPFCRSEVLTTSAFGRELRTLVIGRGGRKVLYTAAHHANEWITALILLKFAEEYARAIAANGEIFGMPARELEKQATIYMVPLVDPDGVDLVTGAIAPGTTQYAIARSFAENYPEIPFPEGWKANLLGVDLNLQYPAGWLRAREIKFRQGFGRLIRSKRDRGVVVVSDPRIAAKNYGAVFRRSIPATVHTVTSINELIDRVNAFFD